MSAASFRSNSGRREHEVIASSVVIAARKADELATAAARLGASGVRVLAVATHTGKPDQVRALFDAAVARFGKVDVVVNNAAANPHFGPMLDAEDGAIDYASR